MSIKGKVKEELQSWRDYLNGRIDRINKAEPVMLELATLLDTLGVPDVSSGYDYIVITTPSIKESRELLSKIFEATSIDRFMKSSAQHCDGLRWGYSIDFKGVTLTIYPAEPDKDCIAVKRTNTYTTWVCEKPRQ